MEDHGILSIHRSACLKCFLDAWEENMFFLFSLTQYLQVPGVRMYNFCKVSQQATA